MGQEAEAYGPQSLLKITVYWGAVRNKIVQIRDMLHSYMIQGSETRGPSQYKDLVPSAEEIP